MAENSVPSGAVVSCHLEQPLEDESWGRFDALRRRFAILPLIRPPDAGHGEDEERWVERAGTLGEIGLHTHWTSPTHARPTAGDPAARVRSDWQWLRDRGFEPRWFCGGGWYRDDAVDAVVQELGMLDCTPRGGVPHDGVLPTTHSLGQLARAVLAPGLPAYVHAYFHDYDLLDARRRAVTPTTDGCHSHSASSGSSLALAPGWSIQKWITFDWNSFICAHSSYGSTTPVLTQWS
jgi:hypothetical protein